MRILFLCEGDAETADSWSGVSRSVVTHLRRAGHRVITGDVDLYGLQRFVVALRTLALGRRRWWVRYHLDEPAFQARSARAAEIVRRHRGEIDLILQVGATFRVPPGTGCPLALYCDSNIDLASDAAFSGYSEASVLTDLELAQIRAREALVYDDADVIFTMSDLVRRSFLEDFRVPPERLVTVHCAPNVPFPEPGSRGDGPPPPRAPRVLFVGRDFGRKGGDLLVKALEEVRRHVPDATLLTIGSELPADRPEWHQAMGFQSRDTAAGREAMDRAYRESSVFCLPTRFEPFGTSFVEAMGYELPCVGPRAWAVPEIIVDGETGYLVEPEDAHALASALTGLLSDPGLARRMGQAGRSRAIEHFTWPGIVERMTHAMQVAVASGVESTTGPAPLARGDRS